MKPNEDPTIVKPSIWCAWFTLMYLPVLFIPRMLAHAGFPVMISGLLAGALILYFCKGLRIFFFKNVVISYSVLAIVGLIGTLIKYSGNRFLMDYIVGSLGMIFWFTIIPLIPTAIMGYSIIVGTFMAQMVRVPKIIEYVALATSPVASYILICGVCWLNTCYV